MNNTDIKPNRLKKLGGYIYREGTPYIILIVLVALFAIINPRFLTGQNLYNLLTQATYYIIAGMAICFVMMTGGIDLSVGHQMAVAGSVSAILMLEYNLPVWLVFPIAMLIGFALGSINGILAAKLKLFPLIITIATSELFKGLAYTITEAKTYSGMPDSFRALYTKKLFGLPLDVYLALAVVLVTWFILNKTHFGRDVLAVGGNKECARLSGINVDLVIFLCYGICGALFALAALDMLAQQNLTSATTGPGTEFVCLTAAIIGGISMMGGKGNVAGLVVGIFIMQGIANGMQLAGWGSYTQYIVKGIILLAAVSFDVIKNMPRPAVRVHSGGNGNGPAPLAGAAPEGAVDMKSDGIIAGAAMAGAAAAAADKNAPVKGGMPPMGGGMPPMGGGIPPMGGGIPPMGGNPPKFGGLPPEGFVPPRADLSRAKRKFLDVRYGSESETQMIDIFLPDEGDGPFPILVHIHGGGFALGDRRDSHVTKHLEMLDFNWAVASVDYRLSGEAIFPAAILDCREAIRFLKEHAAEYKIDPERICVIGGSAGGNLCAMLAMNIPNGEFIGEKAASEYTQTPYVKLAVDWFGPTDFLKMDEQAVANGISFSDHSMPYSAESSYIGTPLPEADPAHCALANPMTYISDRMCKMLIEHGRVDKLVPFQQSEIFVEAITEKVGADRVKFVPLDTADHEDKQFESDENMAIVWDFLKSNI